MERYRIVEDVGLYYITFTIVEWLPVFIDETACKIITDSFNYCIQNKYLGVNAHVILPTHLHAIIFDVEFNSERLKHTLDDVHKFTGRQLLDHCEGHSPKGFSEVFHHNTGEDRQRRFWQVTQHPRCRVVRGKLELVETAISGLNLGGVGTPSPSEKYGTFEFKVRK